MLKITSFLLILSLFLTIPVHAQQSGIEITPAFKEIRLKPGQSLSDNFLIKNNNEYDVDLAISIGEVKSENEILIDNLPESSPARWIEIVNKEINIKSYSQAQADYVLDIPLDADSSVYQPIIVIKVSSNSKDPGTTTAITQLVPYQLRVSVTNEDSYNAELKIEKFESNSNLIFTENQSTNFSLKNVSASLAKPLVRYQVLNPRGEIVYQEVVNDNLKAILPDGTIDKNFEFNFNFYDFSNLGRFKVEAVATDTLTSKNTNAYSYFYVIPLPLILLIVLIFVSIFAMMKIFKKAKRAILNKEKKVKPYYK